MADREEVLDTKLFDRIGHPWRISRPTGHAGVLQSTRTACAFLPAGPVRRNSGRSDHVDHAGGKAKQQENDHPERRCRQQPVEAPANQRPDDNAGDQFGGKLETASHRRCAGSAVSASRSGLVSPDVAAVPNFGQPLIQTSEPCGKRSLVGRHIVISASTVVVRAFSHAVWTRNDAVLLEMTPRHPLKPRGPYLARQTKSRLRNNLVVP
jgi:hypothetical protein